MIDRMSYSFLGGSAGEGGYGRGHLRRIWGLGAQISGVQIHLKIQDEAVERVRVILSMEQPQQLCLIEGRTCRPPFSCFPYENLPARIHQGINVRVILEAIADNSHFSEYEALCHGAGDNVTGKMHQGIPVGVIAAHGWGLSCRSGSKSTEWIIAVRRRRSRSFSCRAPPDTWLGRNRSTWVSESTGRTW